MRLRDRLNRYKILIKKISLFWPFLTVLIYTLSILINIKFLAISLIERVLFIIEFKRRYLINVFRFKVKCYK